MPQAASDIGAARFQQRCNRCSQRRRVVERDAALDAPQLHLVPARAHPRAQIFDGECAGAAASAHVLGESTIGGIPKDDEHECTRQHDAQPLHGGDPNEVRWRGLHRHVGR